MKVQSSLKYFLSIIGIILLCNINSIAQVHRIGGGLAFASGAEFNYGETGNPGLTVKTWLALNKRSTFHIMPSISVYNRYRLETGYSILTNYNICEFGTKRIHIGEQNKEKRICRFCNNKSENVTFKNKAHAISEALGNKTIILNEECDNCYIR